MQREHTPFVFAERSTELELMDDPEVQGPELEQTLEEIENLNRWFGGYAPSVQGLASLIQDTRRVRVLDVGTGSADTPRRLVDWGRANGVEVTVHGIDLTPTTIERAKRLSTDYPEIEISLTNLFELSPETPYDVVHAGLVLHHFVGEEADRALAKMFELARLGVVVNDLHRHPIAWASTKLATALFVKSPMVKNDAALSVRRSFKKSELYDICERVGLPRPEVVWRPMFRWRMLIRRT